MQFIKRFRVGQRAIKTAISVGLALALAMVLGSSLPIFAAIGAISVMSRTWVDSLKESLAQQKLKEAVAPTSKPEDSEIVDYINDLEIAKTMGDKKKVTDVIEQLIDYTQSHFGFEESMMEEAGYKFLKPHKKVHELFIKRVTEFTMRAAKGEDIADELHSMLAKWLINHIASEDRDYSDTVKSMVGAEAAHHEVATQKPEARPGFISGLLGRFFR